MSKPLNIAVNKIARYQRLYIFDELQNHEQ